MVHLVLTAKKKKRKKGLSFLSCYYTEAMTQKDLNSWNLILQQMRHS